MPSSLPAQVSKYIEGQISHEHIALIVVRSNHLLSIQLNNVLWSVKDSMHDWVFYSTC